MAPVERSVKLSTECHNGTDEKENGSDHTKAHHLVEGTCREHCILFCERRGVLCVWSTRVMEPRVIALKPKHAGLGIAAGKPHTNSYLDTTW